MKILKVIYFLYKLQYVLCNHLFTVFIEQSQQLSKKYFAKQEQKLILEIENKQQELKKLQETKKIQVEPKDDSSEDDLFNSEELNSTLTLLSQTQKSTQNEVDKEGLSHTQTSTQKEVDKEDQTEKDGHGQEGALEDILSSQGILIQQQEVEEPKIKKIKIELKN